MLVRENRSPVRVLWGFFGAVRLDDFPKQWIQDFGLCGKPAEDIRGNGRRQFNSDAYGWVEMHKEFARKACYAWYLQENLSTSIY